ncbi:MAG: alpha/beta hydrolase [Planctomycetota bacterium]
MRIRGADIHYETGGATPTGRDQPTLVFIHGFGATLHTWDDLLPALEGRHAVLRMDLKGFGRSGRPRDDRYSLDEHAEIVSQLVIGESHGPVVLVGHSYGGAVAILTWLKLRDRPGPRVSGLVLIDSASYAQRLPFFITLYRSPLTRWAVPLTPPSLRARFVLEHLFVNRSRVSRERVERYASGMRRPGSHAASTSAANQIRPADFAGVSRVIRAIDVPTQIIWGDRDKAVPAAFARRLHEEIAGSTLAMLPNVGHIPQEECPEHVLAVIEPFLASVSTPPDFQRPPGGSILTR